MPTPRNFSWLLPGRLAGLAYPRPADLDWLAAQRVGLLISLTEDPPPSCPIPTLHVPVPDFTPPAPAQLRRLCAAIRASLAQDAAVAVHCLAGRGRTGTALAAWLIAEGLPAEEAIARVRQARPGSIETLDQEDALRAFAAAGIFG